MYNSSQYDIFDLPGSSDNFRMKWLAGQVAIDAIDGQLATTDQQTLDNHYSEGSKEHPIQLIARILANNEQQTALIEQQLVHHLCSKYSLSYGQPDDIEPLAKIPSNNWQRYWYICVIGYRAGKLIVIASEPYTRYLWQTQLERFYACDIELRLYEPARILEHLDRINTSNRQHHIDIDPDDSTDLTRLLTLSEQRGDEKSIEELNRWLLTCAYTHQASDIHLETRRTDILIRFRVDGMLSDFATLPKNTGQQLANRIKVVSGLDVTQSRLPQDGRITLRKKLGVQEVRVSSMPLVTGEKLVLRIFDPDLLYQPLEEIFYQSKQLDKWKTMINCNQGLILVTGPTGSGKTTTLYSTMATLHNPKINICTVEDPVEMVDQRFNQVQVNHQIGMSFDKVLQNLLRQDPDVIMIGEIRDVETASTAVQAALTGHLVLASVHTNDALGAIYRMLDLGVPDFLLQSTLRGVLAQRLVRLLCNQCKGKVSHCPQCRQTGYKGRKAIFELLVIDGGLSQYLNAINREKLLSRIRASGCASLFSAGMELVDQKLTDRNEIFRTCPMEKSISYFDHND